VICFDEISLHRGHGKFVLVISAPEIGLVLDVLPKRSKETLEKWLDERGELPPQTRYSWKTAQDLLEFVQKRDHSSSH